MIDGATFDAEKDGKRLAKQQTAVRDLMLDGQWRTLGRIATEVGAPEASVSARLRDLRKARNGSHLVERRRLGKGLHEYRVTRTEPVAPREWQTLPEVVATQVVIDLLTRVTG